MQQLAILRILCYDFKVIASYIAEKLSQTTGQMLYRLMAAYIFIFYVVNRGFCRLVKANCGPQRHSFHFKQVLFQLMQTLLSYLHPNNADGQTGGYPILQSCFCSFFKNVTKLLKLVLVWLCLLFAKF